MARKISGIEVITRAVILDRDRILLCRVKGSQHYFLPGGHVNSGEKVISALRREIKEELGILIKKISFLGVIENFYRENGNDHHEINLIFRVFPTKLSINSKEKHIEFSFRPFKELKRITILPKILKLKLMRWNKNGNTFSSF